MSRADRALIYAIGGAVGLLGGLGAGALVVGEPAPRVCLSCHSDLAVPIPVVAPAEPTSSPPTRPARPSVALTHPAGRPTLQTTVPPPQPAQEAPASAALTSAAAPTTAAPTSPQATTSAEPSAEPDPPTPPVEPGGVSTSGLLTSGEPPA